MHELLPPEQLLLIFGMLLVTYVPRALPLMALASRDLSPTLARWLEMVPPAVLAALLAPELFLQNNSEGGKSLFLAMENIFLLAALPTLLIGWLSKSFFGTVAVGMGTVALLRYLFA